MITGVIIALGFVALPAHADLLPPDPPKEVAKNYGDISDVIAKVSQWIVNITATVAVLGIIYGGFSYITAAGNEKQAEHAKEIIKFTVIGTVVIILAFTIISTLNKIFF